MAVGPTVPRNTTSGKSAAKSTPALNNRVTTSLNALKNLTKVVYDFSGVIAPGGAFGKSLTKTKKDVSVKKQVVDQGTKNSGKTTPDGVEFNLPPHQWSLPLNPGKLDGASDVTAAHSQRRGKMWLFSELLSAEATDTTQSDSKSNTKNEGGKSIRNSGTSALTRDLYLTQQAAGDSAYSQVAKSYKPAGFQFLWNPDSISVSVSTNPEVVPDAGDRFRSVVGLFPSTEHITFSLVIDRTNDFACAHRDFHRNNQDIKAVANKYEKHYLNGLNQNLRPFPDKLQELMTYGTMHDVEYIFKMLNAGTIFANIQPTNPLGRQTYDLGYLYPALTAVQFGPSTKNLNPISYVGWLQSVSFKHSSFNTNMIPLRTEVAFDLWVYTGFGQVNKE
jgi:hypothetical protein